MTDQTPSPEPGSESGSESGSEPDARTDAVRRLLAEARHDEPMPADVAARMDRVLADLVATTPATPVPARTSPSADPAATVTELPVHRRRRAGALLVAAAAIVVGGVVVAQHLPRGGSVSGETAGSAAAGGSVAGDTGNGNTDSLAMPPSAKPPDAPHRTPVLRDGAVVVRSGTFPNDARAGQSLLRGRAAGRLASPQPACPTSSADQHVVPALYRKAPAALVYHAPDGSTQVVDLVVCGSRRPIRSVTLPAP